MADEKIKRKIAVIFAADVVDYSKHMETDETGTVRSLRECEQILKNLFSEFNGRLFNTGGDSFFAEFSSAKIARSDCLKLPLKVGPFQGGVAMRLGVFLQKVGP